MLGHMVGRSPLYLNSNFLIGRRIMFISTSLSLIKGLMSLLLKIAYFQIIYRFLQKVWTMDTNKQFARGSLNQSSNYFKFGDFKLLQNYFIGGVRSNQSKKYFIINHTYLSFQTWFGFLSEQILQNVPLFFKNPPSFYVAGLLCLCVLV